MGIDLETRRYKKFAGRCGVSAYSRLSLMRWDYLHLGITTLGTALALYWTLICLHLLLEHETYLPMAVSAVVCSYLSVVLLQFKDSLSPGSGRHAHPCTSAKIPRNQICSYRSTLSHVHSDHIQLTTLVIAYLLAHLSLLLLQAGDIEANPGPQTPVPISDLVKLTRLPVTAEWFTLGIQLGLSPDHLRTIQSNNVHYPDMAGRCLVDMFDFWINNDCNSTYEQLATALIAIGREELALEVCRENNLDMAPDIVPSTTSSNLPVSRYANYLKSKYFCKTLIEDDKRQYASRNAAEYINLAIIPNDNTDAREREKFVTAAIHGTISDITNEKGSLELGQIGRLENGSLARCVLVQGAAGIGKTTMAWELCRQWGQQKLLKEYSLVILLKLRDRCVQKAANIGDLIFHPDCSLQSAVASQISKNDGRGTLFLLEGYDELPQDLQENSVFAKLIDGDIHPKAGVIVTSRPSACDMLRKRCCSQVCQQVEILGFTEQQIDSYVKASFGDKHLQHQFISYLDCYPHIAALMAIPVNCSIVIDVFRSIKSVERSIVPRTQTELYSALVRILLGRHLTTHKVHGNKKWSLQSIADFPSDIQQNLFQLSEVAYIGIIQQQLVFHTLPFNLETMGLLNQECDEQGSTSYNFVHLTVQEFLAAYYVSKLPLPDQAQTLDDSAGKEHLNIMLRFVAGLTKFHVEESSETPFFVRLSKFVKGLFKSRGPADCLRTMYHGSTDNRMESLRWMFETQDKLLLRQALGTETRELELSFRILTPFDCYIIGYCLHNSACHWILKFRRCNITETGMRMLSGTTDGSLNHVESINLLYNPVKTGGVHLASALRGNTVLTFLWLRDCGINAEGTSQLAEALCGITTLRVLNLSRDTVDTHGARHLALLLKRTHSLTELYLVTCSIGEDAACQLAEGLRANSTLTVLWLHGNPLGQKGAQALVDSLAHNTSVNDLVLPFGYKDTIKSSVVVSSRISWS